MSASDKLPLDDQPTSEEPWSLPFIPSLCSVVDQRMLSFLAGESAAPEARFTISGMPRVKLRSSRLLVQKPTGCPNGLWLSQGHNRARLFPSGAPRILVIVINRRLVADKGNTDLSTSVRTEACALDAQQGIEIWFRALSVKPSYHVSLPDMTTSLFCNNTCPGVVATLQPFLEPESLGQTAYMRPISSVCLLFI